MVPGRVAVIGRRGQLAQELAVLAWPEGSPVICLGRDAIDLSRQGSVLATLHDLKPSIIINTAAYTAVDRAEADRAAAFALNRDAAGFLAKAAGKLRVPLIQISTDYVMDGLSSNPYREEDSINPLSVYGRSKAEGEEQVRAHLERHIILRTSWVFGKYGSNFLTTILGLAAGQNAVQMVNDEVGSPTPACDLARTVQLMCVELSGGAPKMFGTFHYAGFPPVSRLEFTQAVFAAFAKTYRSLPSLVAIMRKDLNRAAPRPAYSVLDCRKLADVYGLSQPDWRIRLPEIISEIQN